MSRSGPGHQAIRQGLVFTGPLTGGGAWSVLNRPSTSGGNAWSRAAFPGTLHLNSRGTA